MTHLSFTNPGEIDPRAFTIMGLSAKDSTSAIGRFGTGLKYAIAITLRLGGSITIWSGTSKYSFSLRPSTFRNKPVDEIIIHTSSGDFPAPFTSAYGLDWKPWQALRELESNCRDESGSSSIGRTPPLEGQTTIWIDCPEIFEAYKTLDSLFLSPKTLLEKIPHGYADLHTKNAHHNNQIYFRSVAVGEFQKPTLFTYNFHAGVYLTEDRSLQYYMRETLPRLLENTIKNSKSPKHIEAFLTAPTGTFESTVVFSDGDTSLQECYPTFYSVIRSYVDSGRASLLNPSALRNYYQTFELHDSLYEPYEPTDREKAMLVEAQILIAPHFDGKAAPFKLVTSLPEKALGMVYAGKIYISKACFGMGLETLTGTLYEEYCHFYLDFYDETRTFQNHLINTIARLSAELHYERTNTK